MLACTWTDADPEVDLCGLECGFCYSLTLLKQHAFRLYVVCIVVGSFCFATFCFWVFADWSFVCSRLRNFGQDPIGAETSYKE